MRENNMPTLYLEEKLGYLARGLKYLEGQEGMVDTDDSHLDQIIRNAKSVIEEIETWRGEVALDRGCGIHERCD